MKFLVGYPGLTLVCLLAGFGLVGGLRQIGSRSAFQRLWSFSWTPALMVIFLALFWWKGYWSVTTYYHPGNLGVVGDNYSYMNGTLDEAGYYNPQHLYFPWVSGRWVAARSGRPIADFSTPELRRWAFSEA